MDIKYQDWAYKDAAEDFAALAHEPYALFFDGKTKGDKRSCYSYICHTPEEIIEIADDFKGDPFAHLRERLNEHKQSFEALPDAPSFQGGIAGCFSYDLGRHIEALPTLSKPQNTPHVMVGIYKNVIAYDHKKKKAWCFGKPPQQKDNTRPRPAATPLNWAPDCSDEDYLEKIQKIIDYIFAGEIYQACLTRRFEADIPSDFSPYNHYLSLRNSNPAPFSAFMNFGGIQISSCSPEQFLTRNKEKVETRPIKGTLAAHEDKQKLLNSAKDRAENLMIVDLLRNDLGRVCDFDSIKVPELYTLETYEGLHHLVSSVTGTLQKDKDSFDLLKACFPGGSITGAPKIRAMEILEELEPQRRGIHMGTLGMIGFDDTINTSITIRSLVYQEGKVHLQTGGGIVSDSIATDELQESLDKAAKLFESFNDKEKAA